jgi:hypothetical protein
MIATGKTSRLQFVATAIAAAALAAVAILSLAGAHMQRVRGDDVTTLTPYVLFEAALQKPRFGLRVERSLFQKKSFPPRRESSVGSDYCTKAQQARR